MNNNNDLTASATESDSGRSFERDVLPLIGHLHRRALTYYNADAAEPQPWPRESFRNKYAELRANGVQHHPAMMKCCTGPSPRPAPLCLAAMGAFRHGFRFVLQRVATVQFTADGGLLHRARLRIQHRSFRTAIRRV